MADIKKAIIPVAGLGLRFLPLSKVVSKEVFPIGGKPLIQHAIEEAKAAGATEIIFVVEANKKTISDYFKRSPKLERILQERKKKEILEAIKEVEKVAEGLTFSYVTQREQLGDGHAILQAKKLVGKEPCYIMFPDDIIESETPCLVQLEQVFRTAEKPVVALYRPAKERLPFYGVIDGEPIARRLFKVKNIIEKPTPEEAPSDLAIVGRWVITPEVFDYLKKAKPNKKGEIVLSEVVGQMIQDGKIVYGHELEGRWWECGNMKNWLQTHMSYALRDSEHGESLKQFIKDEKLV